MMKTTISRSSRLVIGTVGALMAPTFAIGQDSTVASVTSRTHLVRKGDTLWEIARAYTNDPLRWKQVYQLNTGTVEDPHWIYPGERLRLPGGAAADATAAVTTSSDTPPAQSLASAPSASSPMTVDLSATPMAATDGETVFKRAANEQASRPVLRRVAFETQAPTQTAAPTLRPGEVYAAPYVEREGGPPNAGRIVGTGDVPGIPLTEAERPLQSGERVFMVAPPGMASSAGTRYIAVRRGPLLEGVGQVMIPTGVVTVERAQPGQAVEARVVARFEQLLIGDELVTMEAIPANLPRPRAQTGGAETSVLWIEGEPALPSLQSYVVIAGGSSTGMRAGDQVTFYRERRSTPDGIVLPESEIAVAQVVRATPQASTAIIIHQSFAAVHEGTRGRVSAKMP
jgi:LysM repeat protein